MTEFVYRVISVRMVESGEIVNIVRNVTIVEIV
jgi:hypothetical protein